MEPNNYCQLAQLSSYFHHPATSVAKPVPSPTNGLLPQHNNKEDGEGWHHQMPCPHAVVSSAVKLTLEMAKRKRGRPRKYGTPEQALAAKKTASSSNSKVKRELLGSGGSASLDSGASKKSLLVGFGNSGQGFTPHLISVAAGEDVAQKLCCSCNKISEICIPSASGSISNASLQQAATSGGNITYEIISLSGSYICTELGGRTGGMSVCLSSSDGQIVGGGVGGPLKAAGLVQVIVGTFQIDTKKDVNAGLKCDSSGNKLASSVDGASVSSVGFRLPVESCGINPVRGNDDLQTIGGGHFLIQPSGTHMSPAGPTEWRGGLDAGTSTGYDLTGRIGRGGSQSLENGDYDQMAD